MPSFISVLDQISFLLLLLFIIFHYDLKVLSSIFAQNGFFEALLLDLMKPEPPSKSSISLHMVYGVHIDGF